MGARTKGERERESGRGRGREGDRETEGENKIVQLHGKHYFSFFNKRFHGGVDAGQAQLSAANVGITRLQSAARL